MSSEKLPMAASALEVNTDPGWRLPALECGCASLQAPGCGLLISPPELDGGPGYLTALSNPMPIPGKVFIAGTVA